MAPSMMQKYAAKKHFMYALKLDGQGGFIS
jgi:hypothetical protein